MTKKKRGREITEREEKREKKERKETNGRTCHGIRETVKQVKPVHLSLFHDLTLALPLQRTVER